MMPIDYLPKPKRIVQIVYELASGGAEKFVVDLSNELVNRGEDVTVLMLRDASLSENNFNLEFLSHDVKLKDLKLRKGFSLSHIRKVEKALDELQPDVVHTHLGVLPYIYFYAFRRKKIKFVHTIHAVAQFETPSKILRIFNRILFKSRVLAVTISKVCEETYRMYYGLHNSICIDNGRAKIPQSQLFESVVNELKILPHPIFVHVARCSEEKNQRLLIDAFNKLHADGVRGTLLILGNNYDNHPEIVQMAGDDIYFLGERKNVGDYLSNADFFCLSSLVEGMPISIIEAFSYGIPVISTPAGGVKDMVDNGINGILSHDFSLDTYVSALKKAIETQFSKDLIMKCFENKYSISVCADKYLSIYY